MTSFIRTLVEWSATISIAAPENSAILGRSARTVTMDQSMGAVDVHLDYNTRLTVVQEDLTTIFCEQHNLRSAKSRKICSDITAHLSLG